MHHFVATGSVFVGALKTVVRNLLHYMTVKRHLNAVLGHTEQQNSIDSGKWKSNVAVNSTVTLRIMLELFVEMHSVIHSFSEQLILTGVALVLEYFPVLTEQKLEKHPRQVASPS